jgi:phenylacetate-coenzyme A ligase PaaK-like adenylate-forming protein
MLGEMLATMKSMRDGRRNERLTRAEFEASKLQKFRKLVRHANERAPFYADLIRSRGINIETCVPVDFPVLTKSIVMDNFDRIVTDRRVTRAAVTEFLSRSSDPNDRLFGVYHVLHTSGSSGEVGYFVYSQVDWSRGTSLQMRIRSSRPGAKRHFGRLRIAYYAAVGGHFAGVSMMNTAKHGLGRLLVDLRLFEVNSPLSGVVEELNRFQPDLLTGYPTALKILAAKQREGALRIHPIGVGGGGEAMTLADKSYLEGAFGCVAGNSYGCTEHLMMGFSNPDGRTMTLFDDELIYEFFNDHVLITNVFNHTMPLIRYRMSDILRPLPGVTPPTHPGSPYIVIDNIIGRTEKMPAFINRDGVEDFIHPISVVELFIAGVTRFQMQLVSKTSFRFAIVLDASLSASQREEATAATAQRLREFLDQKMMQNVTFEVLTVEDIPIDPRSGKFKLIVDDSSRANAA